VYGETVRFRRATEDDAAAIAALHALSWKDAYRQFLDPDYLAGPVDQDRLDLWTARFAKADVSWSTTVAEKDPAIIGFACVFGDADPTWGALLDNLHVRPDAKRTGIGRSLLRFAASWVTSRYPSSGITSGSLRAIPPPGGAPVGRANNTPHAAGDPVSLRYFWPDASQLAETRPPPQRDN
jgi:GNAT superfamily N-acetyltransferase